MGLFIADDPNVDESYRQTGFYRYRQVLSVRFAGWWQINLLTLVGFMPLTAAITFAIMTSSILMLLPLSFLGGMIAGPFIAGLYDGILLGLRDDPLPWRERYVRALKQNWRGSLLPGGMLGLLLGLYVFMAMLFWWAEVPPSLGTICLYLFSLLIVLTANTLYWTQLVLFEQKTSIRLRNCLLFVIKYFWRSFGAGLLQLFYMTILVLFAPWTLFLLVITGIWYILFLSLLLLYDQLDEAFQIEESYEKTEKNSQK